MNDSKQSASVQGTFVDEGVEVEEVAEEEELEDNEAFAVFENVEEEEEEDVVVDPAMTVVSDDEDEDDKMTVELTTRSVDFASFKLSFGRSLSPFCSFVFRSFVFSSSPSLVALSLPPSPFKEGVTLRDESGEDEEEIEEEEFCCLLSLSSWMVAASPLF